MRRTFKFLLLILGLGNLGSMSHALVNPNIQPSTFYEAYQNVLFVEVANLVSDPLGAGFRVIGVSKGNFQVGETLKMTLADAGEPELLYILEPGQRLVVFAGRFGPPSLRRKALLYAGGGAWFAATFDAGDRELKLEGNADQGLSGADIHYGIFSGAVGQLWRMCEELGMGIAYFPSVPITRFSAHRVATEEPVTGDLALYDFNGDGTLELAVVHRGKIVFYQQGESKLMKPSGVVLEDGTNLSTSISFTRSIETEALVLLWGNSVYQLVEGTFVRKTILPLGAVVRRGTFADMDGDGLADIVLSLVGGGLRLFLNQGECSFQDVSEAWGLEEPLAEPFGDAYFEVGDWNQDGRLDLVYLVGPGLVLIQDDQNFLVTPLGREETYDFGAAALGQVQPDGPSVVFAAVPNGHLFYGYNESGFPQDLLPFGNEIRETTPAMFLPAIEDLNADGYPDIIALSGDLGGTGYFVMNRGYGSYMLSQKYDSSIFPLDPFDKPATGLALGDVNRDGAVDFFMATQSGELWFLRNETLENRPESVDPRSGNLSLAKQASVRILTVIPAVEVFGHNPTVEVVAEDSRTVYRKQLGGNIGTGSQHAPEAVIALREKGRFEIRILTPHRETLVFSIALNKESPRHQILRFPFNR